MKTKTPPRNVYKTGWIADHKLKNPSDAARLLDVQVITFFARMNAGRYPRPTHKVGRRYFYTMDEVEQLRDM